MCVFSVCSSSLDTCMQSSELDRDTPKIASRYIQLLVAIAHARGVVVAVGRAAARCLGVCG
jgi:hypothetical protein